MKKLYKAVIMYAKYDNSAFRDWSIFCKRKNQSVPKIVSFEKDNEEDFLRKLSAYKNNDLDAFIYFGHGWEQGISSADIRMRDRTFKRFADALRRACRRGADVVLYACSCGVVASQAGFARKLNADLPWLTVYGHTETGTAAYNPEKAVFPPGSRLDTLVLQELHTSRIFKRAWRKAFRDTSSDLWATFFRMSHREIFDVVSKKPLLSAASYNRQQSMFVGWAFHKSAICRSLGVSPTCSDMKFAEEVARWQAKNMGRKFNATGKLDRRTWDLFRTKVLGQSVVLQPSLL